MFKTPLLAALLAVAFLAPARAWAATEVKDVLYLSSYHNGYAWSDGILEGVRQGLADERFKINLQIEYLDAKRRRYAEVKDLYRRLFADKFRQTRFDALVASDNDAYEFLLEYGAALFPNTPVIFCGINDFHPSDVAGRDFTGVLENFDARRNFQIALSLRPHRQVYVYGDSSTAGAAIRRQIQDVAPEFSDRLRFHYRSDLPLADILTEAAALPPDAVIFFIPFFQESREGFLSPEDIQERIFQVARVPMYSCWDFLLGHGIIGGALISGPEQGRLAAGMALRVLAGERASSIPLIAKTQDPLFFDYRTLSKFKIDPDRLPPDSSLINAPPAFYELDKQVFWTLIVSFFLLVCVLFFLARNVARRREVERRLKEQLTLMRSIMDATPLPLSFRDASGRFRGLNAAFENWFGVRSADILGKNAAELARQGLSLPADPDQDIEGRLAEPHVREERVRRADGSVREVIAHVAPYRNARGELLGVVRALFDFTDRKTAEEDLRRAEEKYRGIVENAPLGIYRTALDGRFLDANPAMARMLGYADPADMLARVENIGTDVYLEPEKREEVVRMFNETRSVVRYENRFRRADGKVIAVTMHIRGVSEPSGDIRHFEGFVEDVTERLELERRLLQSQKMEAIGVLAGGVAHDFNNILTSIINSVELVLEDEEAESPARRDLERALRAAHRGADLVRRILTFSRPAPQEFADIDPAEAVGDALALVCASLPKNIVVRRFIPEGLPLVPADPTQLRQAVMNLAANAYQALRETGGTIEVGLEEIALAPREAAPLDLAPGRHLRLTVTDDGPGVAPEHLPLIFDPFFTTKDKSEGTGLGLSVALGVVKAHKGSLRAESSPGQGARFEILLPLRASGPTTPAPDVSAPRPGRERLLFVEDDPDQLAAVPRVLKRLGYRIEAVASPEAALERVTAAPDAFDLVVADFDMPGQNGAELARKIGLIAPKLPVILVSGRERALEAARDVANIRAVVPKPYDGAALSAAIRRALAGTESGR